MDLEPGLWGQPVGLGMDAAGRLKQAHGAWLRALTPASLGAATAVSHQVGFEMSSSRLASLASVAATSEQIVLPLS